MSFSITGESAPIVVDTTSNASALNTFNNRHLVHSSNGTLILFYGYSTTGVYAQKSVDNGATWTDLSGAAGRTQICNVDPSYSGFAVWIDSSDNIFISYGAYRVIYVKKLTYSGGNWSIGSAFTVEPSTGVNDPRFSSICKDSSNNVWIGYYNNTGVNPGNTASTTLIGNIDNTTTTITVTSNSGFGTSGVFSIDTEVIAFTGTTGTTILTGCTRGYFNTTATPHSNGTGVFAAPKTTLNGDVDSSSTTITVVSTAGFSTSGLIGIDSEVITYTGITSTTFTGCTRGALGTTQATHTSGSWVVAPRTYLSSNIDSSTTTITVGSTTGFPPSGEITIESERIRYTGITSTTFTGCTRGYNATTHNSGVAVSIPTNMSVRVKRTPDDANFGVTYTTYDMATTGYSYVTMVIWKNNPACFWGQGSNNYIRWCYYDGSNWSSPVSIASTNADSLYSVAVTSDNNIHLVWRRGSWGNPDNLFYRKCDSSGTWDASPTTLSTNVGDDGPSITTDGTDLWVFWSQYVATNAYYIVYKKKVAGIWDSTTTIVNSDNLNQLKLNTPYKIGSNESYIPIVWRDGTASPYIIKYDKVPHFPRVVDVSPIQGGNTQIVTLTIKGNYFYGIKGSNDVIEVKLNDGSSINLTDYNVLSDTELNAIVPMLTPSGTYDVRITNSGGSNLTSTVKYQVKIGPFINSISTYTGINLNPTTISINGSGFYGGTTSSLVTSIKLGSPANVNFTSYSVTSDSTIIEAIIPSGVIPGTYPVKITTSNGINDTGIVNFVVTTNPPFVTNIVPNSGPHSGVTTVSITGGGFFGGTSFSNVSNIELSGPISANITQYSVSSDTTIINAVISPGLSIGTYDVKVTTGGGTNPTSTNKFYVHLGPVVNNVTPNNGSNSSSTTITITGAGFFGGGSSADVISIKLSNSAETSITGWTVISDSVINSGVIPSGLTPGKYDVRVTTSKGTNFTSVVKFWVQSVPPTVTNIIPDNGSNLSLSTISIIGSNFFGGTSSSDVLLINLDDNANTSVTSYSVISDSEIINAIIPTGIVAGTYNIKVTTNSGVNDTSVVKYKVTTNAPAVTGLNPEWGGNTSPVTISIIGTGFFGGTSSNSVSLVQLGGGPTLTGWTVVSDTLIVNARIPSGVTAGFYNVQITTSGGTNSVSTPQYEAKVGPSVTGVSPYSGWNTSNRTVNITGDGFFGGGTSNLISAVNLYNPSNGKIKNITTYTPSSNTYIENAVIPSGTNAGTYDIKVTTSIGVNETSVVKYIVYGNAPTVTKVIPDSVGNSSGGILDIRGTGFYGGTNFSDVVSIVLDNGVSPFSIPSGYLVSSDTQIINVTVPIGIQAGTYLVKVTTNAGSNTTGAILTITPTFVRVTNVNPDSGVNITQTTVNISGEGFFGATTSSQVSEIYLNDLQNTRFISWNVVNTNFIKDAVIPAGVTTGVYDVIVKTNTIGANTTSDVKFKVLISGSDPNSEIINTDKGITISLPPSCFGIDTAVIVENAKDDPNVILANSKKYKDIKIYPFLSNSTKKITTVPPANFNSGKSALVSILYSGINDPVIEKDFKMIRLNANNEWEILPGEHLVDMVNKTISTYVSQFSIFGIGKFIQASDSLDNVIVYPNPVDFDSVAGGVLKFKNLTKNPVVKIYTISGELVTTISVDVSRGKNENDGVSGEVKWDGTNDENSRVARGLYLYLITDEAGNRKIGKIVVK